MPDLALHAVGVRLLLDAEHRADRTTDELTVLLLADGARGEHVLGELRLRDRREHRHDAGLDLVVGRELEIGAGPLPLFVRAVFTDVFDPLGTVEERAQELGLDLEAAHKTFGRVLVELRKARLRLTDDLAGMATGLHLRAL